MGFFSELKSDLSQAVNTLMPEDKPEEETLDDVRKDDGAAVDLNSMLDRLEDVKLPRSEGDDEEPESDSVEEFFEDQKPVMEENRFFERQAAPSVNEAAVDEESLGYLDSAEELAQKIEQQTESEIMVSEPKSALEAIDSTHIDKYVADVNAETDVITRNGGNFAMNFEQQTPTDEVACITEGMIIKGDLATTGSIELIGKVTGNIKCLGKLNITGEITGDSDAAEVYAESARITGEIRSKGSVKVGQSTVIVGNIIGSSAVIAGAVKGDIDVHGPVVLDTTAIVMGNIKSQSVQINNGAVIEGMCSQAYADVNPSEFFEGLKNR